MSAAASSRNIAAREVGIIDMRQIAATFAAVLGVELPHAAAQAVAIRRDAVAIPRDDSLLSRKEVTVARVFRTAHPSAEGCAHQ